MINYYSVLQRAIARDGNKPSKDDLLQALLAAEKNFRREKNATDFQTLLGSWRLVFITGSYKRQLKKGKMIGAGFYLPSLVKILLIYKSIDGDNQDVNSLAVRGTIENRVKIGLVEFALTGPVKFIAPRNILAFDFTSLTLTILGRKLYSGAIRGGKETEATFYGENLKKQAFFRYFLVDKDFIAARGRGGGLALWKKA